MPTDRKSLQQAAGALGVILSLLFVGYEIRQNTQVARASAVQATAAQIVDWQTEVALDPDWVRIMTFLGQGGRFADLSAEDRMRYQWVVSATVRIMDNRFRQMQLGVIDAEDLGVGGGTANPNWFRSDHLLDWWRSQDRTTQWAPDFLDFFETEVLGIR